MVFIRLYFCDVQARKRLPVWLPSLHPSVDSGESVESSQTDSINAECCKDCLEAGFQKCFCGQNINSALFRNIGAPVSTDSRTSSSSSNTGSLLSAHRCSRAADTILLLSRDGDEEDYVGGGVSESKFADEDECDSNEDTTAEHIQEVRAMLQPTSL